MTIMIRSFLQKSSPDFVVNMVIDHLRNFVPARVTVGGVQFRLKHSYDVSIRAIPGMCVIRVETHQNISIVPNYEIVVTMFPCGGLLVRGNGAILFTFTMHCRRCDDLIIIIVLVILQRILFLFVIILFVIVIIIIWPAEELCVVHVIPADTTIVVILDLQPTGWWLLLFHPQDRTWTIPSTTAIVVVHVLSIDFKFGTNF